MTIDSHNVSVVLPCLNEHQSIADLARRLCDELPGAEVIIVDDGSSPPIPVLKEAIVLRHPYNIGNGAAIKTGARHASRDFLVFLDADGQHDPRDITRLLEKLNEGYDLVVGARSMNSQASAGRWIANQLYNRFASVLTGFRIQDLTSGFRAARAKPFKNFLYLLPNGFSYPTTSTMAFFRCGYSVAYIPIRAARRVGKSKISLLKDGVKFLVIILRIGTLFSPMRFFLPLSFAIFLIATGYYGYTYITANRFTNMSAVLYLSSLFTFLFGIVSEQISALHYRYSEERRRSTDMRTRGNDVPPDRFNDAPTTPILRKTN